MFFVIPIPRRGRAKRTSPVFFLVFALVCLFGAVYCFAIDAECSGHAMTAGDTCVYRDSDSGAIDHINSYSDQQQENRKTGFIALGLSGFFFVAMLFSGGGYGGATATSGRVAATNHAARPTMTTAYQAQIARFAHQPMAAPPPPPAGPPIPGPPPRAAAPNLHHDV